MIHQDDTKSTVNKLNKLGSCIQNLKSYFNVSKFESICEYLKFRITSLSKHNKRYLKFEIYLSEIFVLYYTIFHVKLSILSGKLLYFDKIFT